MILKDGSRNLCAPHFASFRLNIVPPMEVSYARWSTSRHLRTRGLWDNRAKMITQTAPVGITAGVALACSPFESRSQAPAWDRISSKLRFARVPNDSASQTIPAFFPTRALTCLRRLCFVRRSRASRIRGPKPELGHEVRIVMRSTNGGWSPGPRRASSAANLSRSSAAPRPRAAAFHPWRRS